MFEKTKLTEKDISDLVGKRVDVIFSSDYPLPLSIRKLERFVGCWLNDSLVKSGTILARKLEGEVEHNFVYDHLGDSHYQEFYPEAQLNIQEALIDSDSMWRLRNGIYLLDANCYSSMSFSRHSPHKDYQPIALALDNALRAR